MFWLTGEFLSKFFILGRNSDGACVQMALAHHDASHGDERSRGKSEFFRSKQGSDGNIATGLDLTVGLKLHSVAKAVENKSLLSLCKPEFPRKTATLHTSPCSCTGTSVVSRNSDVIGKGLGHSSGDDTNSYF
mmetsp:Transcript_17602/g.50690  ORF Transcript_17602/g.50690 Transcript_17602/m.50690 type:complete len:133 (-) Transcript_17602:531-929(-)